MAFNKAQETAIHHYRGPCMVLAGPGSGKTTVLTHRIRYLVEQKGVSPSNILMITFTRASALEMASRYRTLSGTGQGMPVFGTFHSVFFRILQLSGNCGKDSLISDPIRRNMLEKVFQEAFPEAEPEPELLSLLLEEISLVKNGRLDPASFVSSNGRVDFLKVYQGYRQKMKEAGKIDFDDMLLMTWELLSGDPEICRLWQERFQFIMVDEFQDINRLQYDILKLLSRPENNLFIVGDDDQSIYRFRGSRPELMLKFPEEWPRAETVRLSQNYRSDREIVQRSVKLIEKNKKRYKKDLKAESSEKGQVLVKKFPNETEEYEYVAETILAEIRKGSDPGSNACLVRTKAGLSVFLTKLMEKNIPFYTREIIPNPYTHFLCRPLFAFLNFVNGNVSRGNFLKFMNCPVRYFRREDLRSELVDLQALADFYEKDEKRSWMKERTEFLHYQIRLCKHLKYPFSMVNFFRKTMEYDRYVETVCEERRMDIKKMKALLDEVQDSAADFKTIDEWYAHIAAYTEKLNEKNENGKDMKGRVAVSTLHASKGLEYRTVFLLNCSEGIMPHEKALSDEEIEEERRLFYVGMTRAKKNLHLCHAEERYGKKMEISRFIKEIR